MAADFYSVTTDQLSLDDALTVEEDTVAAVEVPGCETTRILNYFEMLPRYCAVNHDYVGVFSPTENRSMIQEVVFVPGSLTTNYDQFSSHLALPSRSGVSIGALRPARNRLTAGAGDRPPFTVLPDRINPISPLTRVASSHRFVDSGGPPPTSLGSTDGGAVPFPEACLGRRRLTTAPASRAPTGLPRGRD